ncbi:LSU ribosomal protein L13p (L13Ae) [invertebrate metagenome]|uniref:LSU ribosomal protein L13p (L13Ae) n=1 Tax=invertebrate metagenome TaxID=1711999 RepID=A0A484H519_9ZZZZ
MKTYAAKPAEITRKWFVIDAKNVILGRLATEVAKILRGKHKPIYSPHIDTGDHVVVINAARVQLTGNKRKDKRFYWHTGYPGGIKSRTMEQILSGLHPERVLLKAVERMISRSSLGRIQMRKLRVYGDSSHPHAAQRPENLDIGACNTKNRRSA